MKELKSIVNNPRIKEKIKGTTNQKPHSLISVMEKYLTEEEIKSIRKKTWGKCWKSVPREIREKLIHKNGS